MKDTQQSNPSSKLVLFANTVSFTVSMVVILSLIGPWWKPDAGFLWYLPIGAGIILQRIIASVIIGYFNDRGEEEASLKKITTSDIECSLSCEDPDIFEKEGRFLVNKKEFSSFTEAEEYAKFIKTYKQLNK